MLPLLDHITNLNYHDTKIIYFRKGVLMFTYTKVFFYQYFCGRKSLQQRKCNVFLMYFYVYKQKKPVKEIQIKHIFWLKVVLC